jgi:multi antimicrobial extrusion protein matE family protein
MYTGILGGVVNTFLNYIFVFVFNWEIEGLAWATLSAQLAMFLVTVRLLYTKTPFRFQRTKGLHPKFMQNMRMGFDLFIRSFAMQATLYFSFYAATRLGGGKDSTVVATHTILNQVWLFSVFLFDGYCSAGGVLAGRLYSTRQFSTIKYLIRDLFYIVLSIGGFICLLYFISYSSVCEFLTKNKDIQALFFSTFWIVVLMQPINAITFLFDGFYKGLGFTGVLRNAFVLATILGFFPAYYATEYFFQWGLSGIWVGLFIWMCLRGGFLIIHYKYLFYPKTEKKLFNIS